MAVHVGNELYETLQKLKGTLMEENLRLPNVQIRIERIDKVCEALLNRQRASPNDLNNILEYCSLIRGRTKSGHEKATIEIINKYMVELGFM